jgi:protein phosphatase
MAGMSHPGQVRGENEDCYIAQPELGVAVLADGMGGHQAGEVASRMAVDVIVSHFRSPPDRATPPDGNTIARAIQLANTAIHEAANARPDYQGMGSTVVVALFCGDHLYVGHVGDSRAYRLRNHALKQLTKDHSVVQELVNRGLFTPDEARQSLAKNLVTRALGTDAVIEAEITDTIAHPGDIILLCSDGLTDVVSDHEISDILETASANVDTAATRLVEKANDQGGPDNISVVLVHVGG